MSASSNQSSLSYEPRHIKNVVNRSGTSTHQQEMSRMAVVPRNKISRHPSLGSFGSTKQLSEASKLSTQNKTQSRDGDSKNEAWKLVPSVSMVKPLLKTSAQSTAAIQAITATRNKFLNTHSKLATSGGITLSKGLQWTNLKRPVLSISSSNNYHQTLGQSDSVSDTKAKKIKVDRNNKSLSQQQNSNKTLQSHFENMLSSSGYSTSMFCALETGYHCKPTELQKASYGLRLVQAVRESDTNYISKLLECGISTNPCNMFGESIVHMVCRRADFALLKVFIDHGCSVQVSDDFGRTPLHDACWTAEPCFKCVDLLLQKDIRLLNIRDCRGFAPLDYVKKENWAKWIEFFNSKKEIYWAKRNVKELGEEEPPELVKVKPNAHPVINPTNAITHEIAAMLASGAITPFELLSEKQKIISPEEYPPSSSPSPAICI